MAIVAQQRDTVGIATACAALSVPRATFYRRQKPRGDLRQARRAVPRALPPDERRMVLSMLNDDRFADLPPAEVYATLLDEGKFVCSVSTMYRILRENSQLKERRDQLRHPWYPAPELLATRPNELWSWDITKLKGPAKWVSFYLYVILDVFSRYAVGWIGGVPGGGGFGQPADHQDMPTAEDRSGATHHPCRSRFFDDLQERGAAALRPGGDKDPRPTSRLQRQPFLGIPVQDPQVHVGISRPVRFDPGRQGFLH